MIRHYYATIDREKTNKTILIIADSVTLLNNIIDYVNNYTNATIYAERIPSKTAKQLRYKPFTKQVAFYKFSSKIYDKLDQKIKWLML